MSDTPMDPMSDETEGPADGGAGELDEARTQARQARELIDLLGSVRLRRRLGRLSA